MPKTHTVNHMYRLTTDPYKHNLNTFSDLLHSEGIGFISEYKTGDGLEYDAVIYFFYYPEDLVEATHIYNQL